MTLISSSSQGIIPDCFGPVFGAMPIQFWDKSFQYLLYIFAMECPEWPRNQKINQALGDLQLMACGDAAEISLAVSLHPLPSYLFCLLTGDEFQAWRKVAEKRGDLSDGGKRSKSSPKLRNFLATVKREITWRKVFNF